MKYISAQKTQLLDSLENQALFADLGCVIIGKKGIGKSFLLEQLHYRLQNKVYLSEIIADSVITPEQLNKSICLQLGLSWQKSKDELLINIQSNIEQRVLISIDNAHLFSVECLNFLLSLILPQQDNQRNSIYILLAGEAVLANKLNNTEILKTNPSICVVFELEPFELRETKYLISELQSLDVEKIEVLYDEQKLRYFWQLSSGNPSELSNQLNRWLENSKVKKGTEVINVLKNTPLRQYILATVYSIVAVSLILILIFQEQVNQLISPEPVPITESNSLPVASVAEPTAINENTLSEVDDVERLVKDFESETAMKQFNLQIQEEATQPSNDDSIPNNGLAVTKTPQPITEQPKTRKVSKEQSIGNQITGVESKKATFPLSIDEQNLLKRTDSSYVIQWMGVSTKSSAEAFKASHPLKNELNVFRRRYNDGYLYLLVSGDYKNKQDADAAKIAFEKLKFPGQPWSKSIKAIKNEISDLK